MKFRSALLLGAAMTAYPSISQAQEADDGSAKNREISSPQVSAIRR